MDKQRLDTIEKKMKCDLAGAEAIMEGDENYDGADGARIIISLCEDMEEVIQYLREIAF